MSRQGGARRNIREINEVPGVRRAEFAVYRHARKQADRDAGIRPFDESVSVQIFVR
jgi:hypothetical protein